VRKAPATAEAIEAMLAVTPADSLRGLRDRALLLIGFAGGLRRSELVALNVGDIESDVDGVRIIIRRSKTDQEGAGDFVPIPKGTKLKPVAALLTWLEAAQLVEGPVFRPITRGGVVRPQRLTDCSVAEIVKAKAEAAGFDARVFSGHSLRAGFVTSALAAGADILRVMDQTRHREVRTPKPMIAALRHSRVMQGRRFCSGVPCLLSGAEQDIPAHLWTAGMGLQIHPLWESIA
jgi:integrase